MSGVLFGRCFRLLVGPNGGANGREISNLTAGPALRLTFEIEKTTTDNPNTSQISVYNLAPETRALVEKPDTVFQIFAGYVQNAGPALMHSGNVVFAYTRKQGPDYETVLQLADGHAALRDTMISLAMHQGGKAKDAVQQIVKKLGMPLFMTPDALDRTWKHGFSQYGLAKNVMRSVTADTGLEWSVQNGTVQVLNRGGVTSRTALVLSPDSGLIYSPERLREGSQEAAEVVDQNSANELKQAKYLVGIRLRYNGWRVRSMLMPSINPADPVQIQSEAVTGTFRVDKVRHRGDSHGGEWATEMDIMLPDDYAVRQVQTSQAGARRALTIARQRAKLKAGG